MLLSLVLYISCTALIKVGTYFACFFAYRLNHPLESNDQTVSFRKAEIMLV